jgi:hypothetical protein
MGRLLEATKPLAYAIQAEEEEEVVEQEWVVS